MSNPNSNKINAQPTKQFFIYMLTRDVPLTRAIIDLVDNAIDGATRLAPATGSLEHFWVRISLRNDRFLIEDNCGGISVADARDHAFRFGRPPEVVSRPGEIGQFGVGMKRTIFKLGRRFRVISKTATTSFLVDQSVEDWVKEPEWNFQFTELKEGLQTPNGETGTSVEVRDLHEPVSADFQLDTFANQLRAEV